MGRKRELVYYNNRLKGKYLTDKDCRILDNLLHVSETNGCVKDLKNVIYDLSDEEVELIKATKSSSMIDKKVGELTDTQTVGVAYMYFARKMVLGDSVGMGKTVQICGLCNMLTHVSNQNGVPFRFLYLTEKNLVEQTRDELIRFTGEYVDIVRGEKKYVQKFASENDGILHHSIVAPHSIINSVEFQEYMRESREVYGCNLFDAIFIDESAIVGNTSTKTYNNAKHLVSDFDWVIVMNATPFETNLRTFYAQLNLCDDSLLPAKYIFEKLYEEKTYYGSYPKFSGKYKNAHIFREQVKYRYLARTRKSTGAVMEGCSANLLKVPLSPIQKELLKKTSMPQMVYDCPNYFDDSLAVDRYNVPKIGAVLDLLNNELASEKSVLIYCRYKYAQKGIEEALLDMGVSCNVMNGDTPIDEKNNIISMFKRGDFRVLITNVQKGLNFGNCNVCIFYSFDPNPNKMVQFEGRTTRSENIINKHSYLLVSEGRELSKLKELKNKAEASDSFAGSDYSCVLMLLLDKL